LCIAARPLLSCWCQPKEKILEPDVVQLLENIGDTDEHGLSIWCFLKDGRKIRSTSY